MKKRITKRELIERIKRLEQDKTTAELLAYSLGSQVNAAENQIRRLKQIANITQEVLPGRDAQQICMHVDRSMWHEGGKNVMREVILNLLTKTTRSFAADELPNLDRLFEQEDIKHFLGEWLRITTKCYQKHSNNPFVAPPLSFWFQVVTRFLDVIDQLKKAGKDSHKIKDRLIFDAYNNPIQLP